MHATRTSARVVMRALRSFANNARAFALRVAVELKQEHHYDVD